jgi:hypothetical protein
MKWCIVVVQIVDLSSCCGVQRTRRRRHVIVDAVQRTEGRYKAQGIAKAVTTTAEMESG